ncbi:hypothetical protein JOC86_002954 [Bacillus pakistanensis]|uniref:Uncharacterized protein n=1 Tax=Rossellomorea pakistanensis TaxID=992288 RepID=A0ABS2NEY4_9BACI|nr:hypothetical protein [Bacillus pakistanensis]MBM7586402.1 hypothetical protein [Bacillus pakistanensis]
MKEKEKEYQFLPDTQYEGRDQVFLDVDRFINEGMCGGSVHMREDSTNIEEAKEFPEEAPPHQYH